MDNSLVAIILLASLFLVTLSFIAYADCVTTTITCNQTNNDTFPCLLANETYNYNYTFIDCSESLGVSMPLSARDIVDSPSDSEYVPGKNYTFRLISPPIDASNNETDIYNVTFDSNYTSNASAAGILTKYYYPNVTNASNIYTIVLADLPAQSFIYNWHWYVNNGTDNIEYFFINNFSLTISKAVPNISIIMSPDIAVVFGNETTVTGIENNTGDDDVNYTLRRDDSPPFVNATETAILPLGIYTYSFDASGGENWTNRSITAVLTIQSTDTTGVFIPSSSGTVTADTSVDRTEGNANVTIYTISSGSTKNITILKTDDMAVRKLSITTKNKITDAKITITKLQSVPSTVSYEPSAKVFNYLSIEKQNVTDSDFEKVIIRFAVTKQWVSDNNVNYQNIRLYRWSNNVWTELTTNYTSNDSTEYFYEASTPGFSTFAIADNNSISEEPLLEQSCTELWSCTAWSECSDGLQTRVCTDDNECGTVTTKPAESQECGVEEAEVVAEPFPIFQVSIIILIAMIIIVFVVLELTGKLHLGNLRKDAPRPETAIEEIIKPKQNTGKIEYYYEKKDSEDENRQ